MNRKYTSHNRAGDSPEIPNAYFENLPQLHSRNPTAFRFLSPALHLATGDYEAEKWKVNSPEAVRTEHAGEISLQDV